MQHLISPPPSQARPPDVPADTNQSSDATRNEINNQNATRNENGLLGGIKKDILHVVIDERVRFDTPSRSASSGCHVPQPSASMKNGSGVFKDYILAKDPYKLPK